MLAKIVVVDIPGKNACHIKCQSSPMSSDVQAAKAASESAQLPNPNVATISTKPCPQPHKLPPICFHPV